MTARFSQRFLRQYADAPPEVKRALDKQVALLLQNSLHPSLRVKKYGGTANLWQARVNRDWRFYFTIEDGRYRLHEIVPHPK
jgi:mRNA-degrading endonuclease RelE of RelBE toxin-antitoxin system